MSEPPYSVVDSAFHRLEKEAAALEAELARVREAIAAIRPLVRKLEFREREPIFESTAIPNPTAPNPPAPNPPAPNPSAPNPSAPVTARPAGAPPVVATPSDSYRSVVIDLLRDVVTDVLRYANRPMTTAEIAFEVKEAGIQLNSDRQLADFLYRRAKAGDFERVGNGIYALPKADRQLTLADA